MFDVEKIRGEFPILGREVYGKPLVYLDSGATAQKPLAVIEMVDYLQRGLNANIHRGVHYLSEEATTLYEAARERIGAFIGAAEKEEVVFTAGATASLNTVAYAWGEKFVRAGDNILVSEMEHHSNIVPWQMLAERKGAEIRVLPFDDEGRLCTELLPMALVVWWRYRPDKIFAFNPLEIVLTVTFFFLTMYLGYYCYRHLPLIDFLPYKVGVNIWEGMHAPVVEPGETETVLVYRNIKTGKLREFSLDDTAWQDAEKWEWVDTRTTDEMPAIRPLMSEFSLRDAEGDATEEIVTAPGRVYLLCVTSFDRLPRGCAKRFAKVVRRAAEEGARVVCLTPQPLYGVTYHDFGSGDVRCYNIDASTMKTMLRANNGMVVLEDGVIRAKKNCRDIRP